MDVVDSFGWLSPKARCEIVIDVADGCVEDVEDLDRCADSPGDLIAPSRFTSVVALDWSDWSSTSARGPK